MKNRMVLMCVLFSMLVPSGFSQTSQPGTTTAADAASIVGVWRGVWGGDAGGLPCISLTITNETGNLSGAILFYLLRKDEGQPLTNTPGVPEPLINPRLDGKTLTFQVSHRRAHPPRTLNDPPVSFRMTLIGENKGAMNNLSEPVPVGDGTASSGLPMVRTDY
jgi:hypothetical protein